MRFGIIVTSKPRERGAKERKPLPGILDHGRVVCSSSWFA
jgi:hypothetical protein